MELIFLKPQYLAILFAVPIFIFLHFVMLKYTRRKAVLFANFDIMKRVARKYSLTNTSPLLILRIVVIILLTLIISEARLVYQGQSDDSNLVIAIDTSLSMMSDDYDPSRLEFAKTFSKEIINSAKVNNKIGLIAFSDISYVHSGLTQDTNYLINLMKDVKQVNNAGTDLGETIFAGVNLMIYEQTPKNLIIISDGQSNSGVKISEAINYAKKKNVRIFSFGVGTDQGGKVPNLNLTFYLNKKVLKDIAEYTNGDFIQLKTLRDINFVMNNVLDSKTQIIELDLSKPLLGLVIFILFLEFALIKIIYKIVP